MKTTKRTDEQKQDLECLVARSKEDLEGVLLCLVNERDAYRSLLAVEDARNKKIIQRLRAMLVRADNALETAGVSRMSSARINLATALRET